MGMAMRIVTVTYQDGTLILKEPMDIPNGSKVQIAIEVTEDEPDQYLSDWDMKIREESEAFILQHTELLQQYEGQIVAIHDGKVVDHDADKRTLFHRVRTRWGDTPILIREVTSAPIREIMIRSPRLER